MGKNNGYYGGSVVLEINPQQGKTVTLTQPKLSRRAAAQGLLAAGVFLSAMSVGSMAFASETTGLGRVMPENIAKAPIAKQKIFDTLEVKVGQPTKYIPRSDILNAVLKEETFCTDAIPAGCWKYKDWLEKVEALRGLSPREQVEAVNDFINTVPYVSDKKNYDMNDKWVGPDVFFVKGGDCEDFAIAKFASLRRLGFHPDRLRVVLLEDTTRNIQHAVLVVVMDTEVLVLDNLSPGAKTQANYAHYRPICSMDEGRLWVHWKPGSGPAVAGLADKLKKQS